MPIAQFRRTKSDDYFFCIFESVKTAFEIGFSVQNNYLNSWGQVVN